MAKKQEKKTKKTGTEADLLAENKDLTKKLNKEKKTKEELQKNLSNKTQNLFSLKESIPIRIRREMQKTSLLAFSMVVCSIAWLWVGCFNETNIPLTLCITGLICFCILSLISIKVTDGNFGGGILFICIFSAAFGALAALTNLSTLPLFLHYPLFIVLSAFTLSTIVFAGYDMASTKHSGYYEEFHYFPSMIILIIFAAITLLGVIPLSKYHNTNQLKRDEQLVDILQINPTKKGIEVILPPEHFSEQRYLNNVLSVITETDPHGISWKNNSIFCKEGKEEWYKMILSPEEQEITFLFNHAWQDYKTTEKIPVP